MKHTPDGSVDPGKNTGKSSKLDKSDQRNQVRVCVVDLKLSTHLTLNESSITNEV